MRFVFLIISIMTTHVVNCQTFLDKRFTASAGVSVGVPLNGLFIGYVEGDDVRIEHEFGGSIFPPKLEGRIGLVISSRLKLDIYCAYHGIQNSSVIITTTDENFYLPYIDLFEMRTNVKHLGGDLRYFFEYAPVGKYFNFGACYANSASTVYSTLNRPSIYVAEHDIYKLPKWETSSSFFCIDLGLGRSELLSPNLFLDFGMKTSIYIGKPKNTLVNYSAFEDVNSYNHKVASEGVTNRLTWSNLQCSNLLQFYVTFGFIK